MKIPLSGRGGSDRVFKTGTFVVVSFCLQWISRHLAGILYLLSRWCSGAGELARWFQTFERVTCSVFILKNFSVAEPLVSIPRPLLLA